MTWPNYLAGQELYASGVLKSPRRNVWNFVGATAVYNESTRMWDITTGGGGGSGHTIEDEGVALTARTSLNFVGPNVSVADSGGKTVVTIGAISLTGSGISGTLPYTRGGTGLGALGTAGQSFRVNAGATAIEWYTPAAGITVPGGDGFRFTYSATTTDADPGAGVFRANHATLASATQLFVDLAEYGATDVTAWLDQISSVVGTTKGRIRLASIADPTKWVVYNLTGWTTATGYRKLTVTYVAGPGNLPTTAGDIFLSLDLGPVGGYTNSEIDSAAAIVLSKLADGTACSVVTRAANSSGAHADLQLGTNGFVLLRRSNALIGALLLNENFDNACALAVSKLAVGTALQQLRVNAGATSLEYFSPPSPVVGTDLTNASVTKHISDGSQFTLPAGTLASSTKTLTLGTSGTPEVDEIIEVIVYSQSQNYVLANGGPLADTLYTVVAGTKRVLHASWNGTDWRPAGKIRLT